MFTRPDPLWIVNIPQIEIWSNDLYVTCNTSVGITFPGLEPTQKCELGEACTVKCHVTAGHSPDIDWLTKDGVIDFQSGEDLLTRESIYAVGL